MTPSPLKAQLERIEAMFVAGWRAEAGQSFRGRHIAPLQREIAEFDRASASCLSELERIMSELP
jgi:hypothetical protein